MWVIFIDFLDLLEKSKKSENIMKSEYILEKYVNLNIFNAKPLWTFSNTLLLRKFYEKNTSEWRKLYRFFAFLTYFYWKITLWSELRKKKSKIGGMGCWVVCTYASVPMQSKNYTYFTEECKIIKNSITS